MSKEISIQVTVAGRKYPLTIAEKDESLIKRIASELSAHVSTLQSNYSVQDKQDLLAMAALQVATKAAIDNNTPSDTSTSLDSELQKLYVESESLI